MNVNRLCIFILTGLRPQLLHRSVNERIRNKRITSFFQKRVHQFAYR